MTPIIEVAIRGNPLVLEGRDRPCLHPASVCLLIAGKFTRHQPGTETGYIAPPYRRSPRVPARHFRNKPLSKIRPAARM
jgi:hypothetical protein